MLTLKIKIVLYLCLSVLLSMLTKTAFSQSDYNIGVYYFPGWIQSPEIIKSPPWDRIKPFPEKEPLLGWYPEKDISIAKIQLNWMSQYGINFVIYDWYWVNNFGPSLTHSINSFRKLDTKNLKFTILWANHSEVPTNFSQYEQIVKYWIDNYFSDKRYLRIDDKPVVYIFLPERLDKNAHVFGMTGKSLIEHAREMAIKAGYKGIYFVASTQALKSEVIDNIPNSSYDAITAYNYHLGLSGKVVNKPMSRSYKELTDGYFESWSWILNNSKLPYFVPVSSGWDKRPWGGSIETEHDNSISSPATFASHLKRAKDVVDRFPEKTKKIITICCWNEYGEGSYIEPTKKWHYQYLQTIKDVFSK